MRAQAIVRSENVTRDGKTEREEVARFTCTNFPETLEEMANVVGEDAASEWWNTSAAVLVRRYNRTNANPFTLTPLVPVDRQAVRAENNALREQLAGAVAALRSAGMSEEQIAKVLPGYVPAK